MVGGRRRDWLSGSLVMIVSNAYGRFGRPASVRTHSTGEVWRQQIGSIPIKTTFLTSMSSYQIEQRGFGGLAGDADKAATCALQRRRDLGGQAEMRRPQCTFEQVRGACRFHIGLGAAA